MHLLAVLAAAQPALEFVGRSLEGTVEGFGAALAAHHRAASGMRGDLDMLAVLALPTIVLVGELDVEPVDRVIDAFSTRELSADVDAEVIGNLDVTAGHLDVSRRGGVGIGGG